MANMVYNDHYYYYGRNAIYSALKILKVGRGDIVLSPSWDCGEVLEPFNEIGCKIIYYRTDPITLSIDLHDLESKLSNNSKVLHIINHFGFPQPWEEILPKVKRYGIKILEDNAFTYPTKYRESELGRYGDVSIFSFRKIYGINSGALLRNNRPTNFGRIHYPLMYRSDIRQFPYLLMDIFNQFFSFNMKSVYNSVKPRTLRSEIQLPLNSDSNKVDPGLYSKSGEIQFGEYPQKPASRLNILYLSYYRFLFVKQIAPAKRKRYKYLAKHLADVDGITILHPQIDKKTVPYVFSMLVSKFRDSLFKALLKEGYPVWVWPSLPKIIHEELPKHPDVMRLGQQLLQIQLYEIHPVDYESLVERIKYYLKNIELHN
jgi:hypothetical protein